MKIKGVGEAAAPAHAPYLHPCRQQMRVGYICKWLLLVTAPFIPQNIVFLDK